MFQICEKVLENLNSQMSWFQVGHLLQCILLLLFMVVSQIIKPARHLVILLLPSQLQSIFRTFENYHFCPWLCAAIHDIVQTLSLLIQGTGLINIMTALILMFRWFVSNDSCCVFFFFHYAHNTVCYNFVINFAYMYNGSDLNIKCRLKVKILWVDMWSW